MQLVHPPTERVSLALALASALFFSPLAPNVVVLEIEGGETIPVAGAPIVTLGDQPALMIETSLPWASVTRARAIDEHGQASEWSNAVACRVDLTRDGVVGIPDLTAAWDLFVAWPEFRAYVLDGLLPVWGVGCP